LPKYAEKNLHGLLVVDKPVGVTSAEIVRRVRFAAGNCKTGHAGTLDPLASGVLVCALGQATKSINLLMELTKTYEAEADLSAFSVTDDAEGPLEPAQINCVPTVAEVESALAEFIGEVPQTPPIYSALKIGGRPAYWHARRGRIIQPSVRMVRIERITINRFEWPCVAFTVVCGKGVYIRSLAREIGMKLGTGGYLTGLIRTAVGPYNRLKAFSGNALPERIVEADLLPVQESTRAESGKTL
jgi:tRNA pseudouridine55 synthase